MPSPGVFGHRQQLELNKNFWKFLTFSICIRKKLSRIEIHWEILCIRWFHVRDVRLLIRETFQVKITEETTTSSSRIFIKVVDEIQQLWLTPTRWSRWLCRSSFKNFRNSPGLKWTNQLVQKKAQTEWPNDPTGPRGRHVRASWMLLPQLVHVWCDSGGVSRSWWIVYVKKSWSLSSWDSSLRTLKTDLVVTLAREALLKLCRIWYHCRTTQRACVSPSTTSLRLVLESWQRSGVERQVEGKCPQNT